MAQLRFNVKVDVVLGGRICAPADLRVDSRARLASDLSDPDSPGDITGFYLFAYVGRDSPEHSVARIQGSDCTAPVSLRLRAGDPDTLKLGVMFQLSAPRAKRACHVASGFVPVSDLKGMLLPRKSGAPGQFTMDQPCVVFKDNFSSNQVILRFADAGTDHPALSSLRLERSALHNLAETSESVGKLGQALQASITRCAVSPLNAGVQFLDSFTYGHLENHLSHYAILGRVFKAVRTGVQPRQVVYSGLQAMHSTDLGFDALDAMPDHELALRFGVALVTRHTSCALSNVYCTDYMANRLGQTVRLKETEDIARTHSAVNAAIQMDLDYTPYPRSGARKSELSVARALDELQRSGATRLGASGAPRPRSVSKALNTDDCENLAWSELQVGQAILDMYVAAGSAQQQIGQQQVGKRVSWGTGVAQAASLAPAPQAESAARASDFERRRQAMAAAMARETQGDPLFAAVRPEHYGRLANSLCRLGAMMSDDTLRFDLLVASAKGPNFDLDNPETVGSLSGHGAGVVRVREAGTGHFIHAPMEATTYARVDRPPPPGYCLQVPVRMVAPDGSLDHVEVMDVAALATAIGQNVRQELQCLSTDANVLAHFSPSYKDPKDCPFYVSAFYTGLPRGPGLSLGCAAVDTCPSPQYQAGDLPLFGAPVMSMSDPSTMAISVNLEALAGAGVRDPAAAVGSIEAQAREAWGPPITQAQVKCLMSYWQPLDSPDLPALGAQDYASHVIAENTFAHDDPEHTALALRVLQGLAQRFNEVQAADPASDGARARAYGQFLSATLQLTLPIPRKNDKFSLSCMRNLRRAAADVGLKKAQGCPVKARMITARARVKSDHLFYMCERGEGFVHAMNKTLA